jgi:hypothetical protein
MPAMCVSSISPRFHYRRLAFCFLPVAAFLESQQIFYINGQIVSIILGFVGCVGSVTTTQHYLYIIKEAIDNA